MRQGLRPEISLTLSPGASRDFWFRLECELSHAPSLSAPYFTTEAWSKRKYHCGLNW